MKISYIRMWLCVSIKWSACVKKFRWGRNEVLRLRWAHYKNRWKNVLSTSSSIGQRKISVCLFFNPKIYFRCTTLQSHVVSLGPWQWWSLDLCTCGALPTVDSPCTGRCSTSGTCTHTYIAAWPHVCGSPGHSTWCHSHPSPVRTCCTCGLPCLASLKWKKNHE